MASLDPLQASLEEGLEALGRSASPDTCRNLLRLAELLAAWAPRINLTGHREPDGIVRNLVLDATALLEHLPAWSCLADLGSGAGFPGLPFAILEPSREVLLVEARERRHHFQRAVIRELGLENATAVRGRIEDLEARPCDIAIAQAVGPLAQVAELALPWVRSGGWLAIPTAAEPPEIEPIAGLQPARTIGYSAPLGGSRHALWLARRISAAPPAAV